MSKKNKFNSTKTLHNTRYAEREEENSQNNHLRIIRIFDMRLVPRELIEDIPGRDYEVDRVYELSNQINSSPFNLLYVLSDAGHKIQGFFWAGIDPLTNYLYFHSCGIAKYYRRKGIFKHQVMPFLQTIVDKGNLKGIRGLTVQPELHESVGWERTDLIFMEYNKPLQKTEEQIPEEPESEQEEPVAVMTEEIENNG
jgi:hypothetical protein